MPTRTSFVPASRIHSLQTNHYYGINAFKRSNHFCLIYTFSCNEKSITQSHIFHSPLPKAGVINFSRQNQPTLPILYQSPPLFQSPTPRNHLKVTPHPSLTHCISTYLKMSPLQPNSEPPDSLISAEDGRKYWSAIDPDVNGMLGGFPAVSRVDLRGSRSFLAKLGLGRSKGVKAVERALEGGAGIGRITQGLLVDVAETVDVVEPIAKFTAALQGLPGVGRIYNVGLEEWRPEEGVEYDLVWNQWCVGHLTDQQLEEYLRRCSGVLSVGEDGKTKGVIVVKENLSTSPEDLFDAEDSSVTRQDETFRRIFEDAGLRIIRTEIQHGFPHELYPVRMYALKPKA
ncbi:AdoMet dependent proline di-methyltransferase-domain-containing protein [Daldinia sp. FL1419]|nr:AdoMet dependent proline di-methyltransferase-domain-containing protein [Daldinia sp. FL1419]